MKSSLAKLLHKSLDPRFLREAYNLQCKVVNTLSHFIHDFYVL